MVEAGEGLDMEIEHVIVDECDEKMKVIYPKAKEELIDFLNQYKLKYSEVMSWPRCISVFDKEASKILQGVKPSDLRKRKWRGKRP